MSIDIRVSMANFSGRVWVYPIHTLPMAIPSYQDLNPDSLIIIYQELPICYSKFYVIFIIVFSFIDCSTTLWFNFICDPFKWHQLQVFNFYVNFLKFHFFPAFSHFSIFFKVQVYFSILSSKGFQQ